MYVRVNSIYKYNDNLIADNLQQKRLLVEKIFEFLGRFRTLLEVF